MARPHSPVFVFPEPAGLDEVVYDLVYYGTRSGLRELFALGASESGRTQVEQLVNAAPEGKLSCAVWTSETGDTKLQVFRVCSEPMIENLYVSVRQLLRIVKE